MNSRLHPDDIKAIATQVAALLAGSVVADSARPMTSLSEARIRNCAQADLAAALARKALKRKAVNG